MVCNFNYHFINNAEEILRKVSFVFHTSHNPKYHTKKFVFLIEAARGSIMSTSVLSFISSVI